MPDPLSAKSQAAVAAAGLVQNDTIVGLGSGTTAELIVKELGRRVIEEGLRFTGVSTSEATADLARQFGIALRELDDVPTLDVNLDGADEIDSQFRMIKGRGGALLREKIVASVARRRVTVITTDKRVDRLGLSPVPVEVSALGCHHIDLRLRSLGAQTVVRTTAEGRPFLTDGGNRIIDCRFRKIDDPEHLDHALKRTIGVFETGLFINLCDLLIVGDLDGVQTIETGACRVSSF